MNIWIVNHYGGPPNSKRFERPVYTARAFASRDHACTLFSAGFHHLLNAPEQLAEPRIKVHDGSTYVELPSRCYGSNGLARVLNMLDSSRALWRLAKNLPQSVPAPDLVIVSIVSPLPAIDRYFDEIGVPQKKVTVITSCIDPQIFEARNSFPLPDIHVPTPRRLRERRKTPSSGAFENGACGDYHLEGCAAVSFWRQPQLSPNKVSEYLLAEKAAVWVGITGNDPIAESGAGISIPANDPLALEAALTDLATRGRGELAELGRRGKKYALETFNGEKLGAQYEALARNLIEARSHE